MTDKEYFEFIFYADESEAAAFYDSLSLEQLAYYRGLLLKALSDRMIEGYDELEIDSEDADFTDAKTVLKKIMEK